MGSFSTWKKNSQCQENCKFLFTRKCIFKPCDPKLPLTKYEGICSSGKCQPAKWTEWSSWSSENCDLAYFFIKSRWRECLRGSSFSEGECEGDKFEIASCEENFKIFNFLASEFIYFRDNFLVKFFKFIFG